jgi:putative phosphoesterase
LPRDCLRFLEEADAIVHTGDFTAASVLDALRRHGPVTAVQGNMDDATLRASLPVRTTAEVDGMRVGVVHDGGPAAARHERLRDLFPDCDLVAYGHSHLPEVRRDERGWIVNPGSPTERRRAPDHTMVVVEGGEPRLVVL